MGNLSSNEAPTTCYKSPVITNIFGPGSASARTAGGELVFISGMHFGSVLESHIDGVFYTNNAGLSYTAVNCSLVVDDSLVQCYTVRKL